MPSHTEAAARPVKTFRLVVGFTLILVGLPLFILPVPLGLFLLLPGFYLVLDASPWMRRRFCALRRSCRRCAALLGSVFRRRNACLAADSTRKPESSGEDHTATVGRDIIR